MATAIRTENLTCDFGTVLAADNVTTTFPAESVTCLLGPSGSGKTTLMRMLAGLQEPTSGEIYFGDERVTDLTPSQRNIGMVFQYPVVYRGTTLYQSVELPLRSERGISKKERQRRVDEVLAWLDLTEYAKADVSRLDNATRQKAAVARAVARQPSIILFDEPITNVDVESKVTLKRALKRLVKQHAQTIIYVTHDQTEAMTLADEIALMDAGRIIQRGTPRELYNHPNSRFGGWFLGNPGMNFVKHSVERQDGQALLSAPLFGQPIAMDGSASVDEVIVGIRPERIRLDAQTSLSVQAEVVRTAIVVGGQQLITLRVGDEQIKVKTESQEAPKPGTPMQIHCPPEHITLFAKDGTKLDAELSAAASPA